MRQVPEWIGKTDDAAIPPRVKLRIVEKYQGRCAECGRRLIPTKFAIDHILALANGGTHSEGNLQPLCNDPCHSKKTKKDQESKAKSYTRRKSNYGLKTLKKPFPGGRRSEWKRTFSKGWVRR